jgi:hypothetical protein
VEPPSVTEAAIFEFVFTLFGLLLGLSLAEVLGGYARAMRTRETVPVGFLTPMLGLLVMLDLITFWAITWLARDKIMVANLNMFVGFAITSVYYLAATNIFPASGPRDGDYDGHYFVIKRKVIGAILFCNLTTYASLSWLFGRPPRASALIVILIFTALYAAAFAVRGKGLSVFLLTLLLAAYVGEALINYPTVPA